MKINKGPRYIRCYDSGGSGDRYTIVYTGRRGGFYLGCNAHPTHPQGIGQHGDGLIDRPTSKHLGKRIRFEALPDEVSTFVAAEYANLWKVTR